MATEHRAAVACGDEKQSFGGLGRAEQFIMTGQGIFTVWNSLRRDDVWRSVAVIFRCVGSHSGM